MTEARMALRSRLPAQDVIYAGAGGGNRANLLAVWRTHGVDRPFREAYDRGTLLCGISAGANVTGAVTRAPAAQVYRVERDGAGGVREWPPAGRLL